MFGCVEILSVAVILPGSVCLWAAGAVSVHTGPFPVTRHQNPARAWGGLRSRVHWGRFQAEVNFRGKSLVFLLCPGQEGLLKHSSERLAVVPSPQRRSPAPSRPWECFSSRLRPGEDTGEGVPTRHRLAPCVESPSDTWLEPTSGSRPMTWAFPGTVSSQAPDIGPAPLLSGCHFS